VRRERGVSVNSNEGMGREAATHVLEGVARLDLLLDELVLLSEGLSLGDHAVEGEGRVNADSKGKKRGETYRSMSACERRPFSFSMVIWLDFPVPLSAAETFMILLAERQTVSTCEEEEEEEGKRTQKRRSRR
jgi:hypothetical protein